VFLTVNENKTVPSRHYQLQNEMWAIRKVPLVMIALRQTNNYNFD